MTGRTAAKVPGLGGVKVMSHSFLWVSAFASYGLR